MKKPMIIVAIVLLAGLFCRCSREPASLELKVISKIPTQDWEVNISVTAQKVKTVEFEVVTPIGEKWMPIPPVSITDESAAFQQLIPLFDEKTLFQKNDQFVEGDYAITAKFTDGKQEADHTVKVTLQMPPVPAIEIIEKSAERIAGKTSPKARVRTDISEKEIPVNKDGEFTVAPVPHGTQYVKITAINWAGEKTEEVVDFANINLNVDTVRIIELPSAPPPPVTVSGKVTATFEPVVLRLIQPKRQNIAVNPNGTFTIADLRLDTTSQRITIEATDSQGNSRTRDAEVKILYPPKFDVQAIGDVEEIFPLSVTISGSVIADLGLASLRLISPYESSLTVGSRGEFAVTVELKRRSDIILEATDSRKYSTKYQMDANDINWIPPDYIVFTIDSPADNYITREQQVAIKGTITYKHIKNLEATRGTIEPDPRSPNMATLHYNATLKEEGPNIIRLVVLDTKIVPTKRAEKNITIIRNTTSP